MNNEIELRHLRYFVAVAEELHFGRAAQRLNLAQPPLSQQIRKLEAALGCPLFVRTSRAVKLTAAGHVFFQRAQSTLRNVHRDMAEARSIGRGEVGFLNVGFVGSGMLTSLPGVFHRYRSRYPRVQLHLHESFTSRVVDGLQNGTLDAGFLRDSGPVEGLTVIPLFSEPFIAVLPATHPRAKQKSISASALREDPFVYYPQSAGAHAFEKPLTLCTEHGFRPHIVQEASHWLTILRLVGAGFGITIAPVCVRKIASAEVVCLPIRGASIVSDIELAYRSGEDRPIVQSFAQMAQHNHSSTQRTDSTSGRLQP